jgi:hypothetical protein
LTSAERVADPLALAYTYRGLGRELGERYLGGVILTHLGDAHHAAGDRASARTAWADALQVFTELDHPDAVQVRAKLAE